MTTMSIDEMKQRILKPKRTALNANKTNPADSQTKASTQAPLGGPRGETHPSVESGAVANQARPLSDTQMQRRYHPSRVFTGALHPSVYPSPLSSSESRLASLAHPLPERRPTPPCSVYPNHLGYRRFHSFLPRDSFLRPA